MVMIRDLFSRVWPVIRAPYRITRTIGWIAIDVSIGVETTLLADQLSLGSQRSPDFEHGSVGWIKAWRLLRRARLHPSDVFYDIGSGTGRMALTASRFHLARVIGIDNSERTVKIATENLRNFRLERKSDVEIKFGDVLLDTFPDDVTVIFFYNPFRCDHVDQFLTRIFESLDRKKRTIKFIYHNPFEHDRLMKSGRFKLIDHTAGLRPTKNWSRTLSVYYYEVS